MRFSHYSGKWPENVYEEIQYKTSPYPSPLGEGTMTPPQPSLKGRELSKTDCFAYARNDR